MRTPAGFFLQSMKFTKPPLSIDEQIDLLVRRGMAVPDRSRAERYLRHINYYRLRIYWIPFEKPSEGNDHLFNDGVTFDDVLYLYVFDRKLRLLILEAVERFEISFRSRIVNHLATTYGSDAYHMREVFRHPPKYSECLAKLEKSLVDSRETFIAHYRETYSEPSFPPIWSAFEILTFGELALWFEHIGSRQDRKKIAEAYALDEKVLNSFAHHLSHVRNICAHHGRLWNKHLTIVMKQPSHPSTLSESMNMDDDARAKIYNTLTVLAHLMRIISPSTTWPDRIAALIKGFERVNLHDMGFPRNWKDTPIWFPEPSPQDRLP
jgi:abortive infection bacteriophage resistance protein